jgi:catechol 2,3-dioxygenase-like lactoylglutathione lyase family enzyme
MIGYVTIGVRDMDAAKAFYTALTGHKVLFDGGRIAFIGESMGGPMIAVCIPYDENDPHPGNGTMIALKGGGQDGVRAMYDKAIDLGATCDGEPGQRIPDVFYGAYAKDPDGNKLCFYDFS